MCFIALELSNTAELLLLLAVVMVLVLVVLTMPLPPPLLLLLLLLPTAFSTCSTQRSTLHSSDASMQHIDSFYDTLHLRQQQTCSPSFKVLFTATGRSRCQLNSLFRS